jgi:CrcB protein
MKVVALSYLFVAVGGALGAMARFGMNVMLQRDTVFPWGTLGANLVGCFVIRLLFAIGFCGSFTTLSALVMEMHTMLQRGELFDAFAYMTVTMIGGFVFFYAGFILTRGVMTFANA